MSKSRLTQQKELIQLEINKISLFFSAEELHKRLVEKRVGIATVYRYLNNLEKLGLIHSYNCDRRKIYSKSKTNHSHFTCEKCSKVTHFNISDISFIKNKIKSEICHFEVNVTGICENCKIKLLEI